MTFADKLRQLREAAGLTLAALAAAAGLGLPTVKDYEGGRRSPTLQSAQKLARALGVTCQAFDGCRFERARQTGHPAKPPAAAQEPRKPAKGGGAPPAKSKRSKGRGRA